MVEKKIILIILKKIPTQRDRDGDNERKIRYNVMEKTKEHFFTLHYKYFYLN